MALVVGELAYTGSSQYASLLWNLFLAWIPFAVAIRVYDGYRRRAAGLWLWAGGLLWLVFFPNAPYIVTDFKYLRNLTGAPIWYDAVLIRPPPGVVFCSVSPRSTRCRPWSDERGERSTRGSSRTRARVSSFGVYLGRPAWNSWDVFTRPSVLAADLWSGLVDPLEHPR